MVKRNFRNLPTKEIKDTKWDEDRHLSLYPALVLFVSFVRFVVNQKYKHRAYHRHSLIPLKFFQERQDPAPTRFEQAPSGPGLERTAK